MPAGPDRITFGLTAFGIAPHPGASKAWGNEMGERSFAILDDRAALRIAGADRIAFLQGLISNDVEKASADRAIYAAFLTAQGKYLHDFFVVEQGETLLVDCEGARADDLLRRLTMYKLRSQVTIDPDDNLAVAVAFGSDAADAIGLTVEPGKACAIDTGVAFVDPRLPAAGVRVIASRDGLAKVLSEKGFDPKTPADYDRLRLSLGLPDGSRDLIPEKSTLLENGFDELRGVDWDKGCFLGQELTARTRYRGLVKKRLLPIAIEGAPPAPGEIVRLDGKAAGEIRSVRDGIGLALIRLDALDAVEGGAASLMAGEARILPRRPDWLRLEAAIEP